MVEAFVAITTAPGAEDRVFEELCNMPEVKEVYMIYGPHDLIAYIEAPNTDHVRQVVLRIRQIEGVKTTTTMTVSRKKVKR